MTEARKRNRASARAAGTRFATSTSAYLAYWLGSDFIEKRNKTGARDRGDITGVRAHGQRVTIECKDSARLSLGTWANQTEAERINDDGLVGLIFHKRHGVGDPGSQWVTCTLRDLVALMSGRRPDEVEVTTNQPRETTNDQP